MALNSILVRNLLLIFFSLLHFSVSRADSHATNPIVNTTCGPVIGTTHKNPDGSLIDVFKSIPYAAPPLGSLRWAAPQPPTCWHGAYNATEFRDVCLQEYGVLGSEDCLFLDVHRPTNITPGAPIIFYIHGGSLLLGAGASSKSVIRSNCVAMHQRLH